MLLRLCCAKISRIGGSRRCGVDTVDGWSRRDRSAILNPVARILAQQVVERFVPDGLIAILGDNTATQHPGSTSIAKGGIATRVVHALVHRLAMGAQMGGAASETPHHCLPY